ncbi:peptide transporter family 1-like [Leguminivora glycinivorella]|uniref:peptide transporter family 1-like n=1 Tax=Leguminivora glycinivorella TaxID=1035111 RepID=UPI002010B8E1|nr:peptide transporter family 1-like [Leguminivora glycinivorella]
MSKNSEDLECDPRSKVKDRFPRIVIIIVMAEFCERFSYSGMRAFLTLYLRSKLGYSDDEATELYHVFSTFVYLFPIFGGIMADNYLGKFRTILYMMFVYAAGNLLVAVTAIPQLALPGRLCTLLGLFLITVGTGGIKPCVTAFGGDQFRLPEQEKYLAVYFSVLYVNTCAGSLIAKSVSPILRSEVHCFGDKDCYSLAFGAPGFVVLCSIVIFVSARNRYLIKKPQGNVVVDFVKCVTLGLKNLILRRKKDKNSHWLDSTQHQYDQRFIRDIKKTFSILMLFTVIPVFWALLDQMGSRWTLQATKVSGNLGFVTIKPDQLQVINPISIIILIPLLQKYVYPFFTRRNMLVNPLHKLTLGGVLAGIAFIVSAVMEIYIKTTYPQLPTPGLAQLRIFNGNPYSVNISNHNISYSIPQHNFFVKKDFETHDTENLTLNLSINEEYLDSFEREFILEENKANSYFLDGGEVYGFFDNVDKSKSGLPIVRFLVSHRVNATDIKFYNEKRNEIETQMSVGVSQQMEVFASTYSVWVGDDVVTRHLEMKEGAVYTVLVDKDGDEYKANVVVVTEPNSISMAWLLPQFLIMAVAEVLFCVTGNEFAFKESPESMKAVMSAIWMLTEAMGNILIIIVTRFMTGYEKETQLFFYTGLMFVAIFIFHFMARNYQFREETDQIKDKRSNSDAMYLEVAQTEDLLDH